MAERTALTQRAQIGIETTPGTAVAATKQLQSLEVSVGPKLNVRMTRPAGYKVSTLAAPGKEWVEGRAQGQMTYTEIVYLLASVFTPVTPVQVNAPGGQAYRWTFAPSATSEQAFQTYTLEYGSPVRAHRMAHTVFTGLTLTFNRENCEVTAPFMARALEDPFTLTTSGVSALALMPVLGTQVSFYVADTPAGLSNTANKLTRAFSAEFSIDGRYEPLWVVDAAQTSFVTVSEKPAAPKLKFTVEADAAGMALLETARLGDTKFVRLEAIGRQIDASPPTPYRLTLDAAVKITSMSDLKDEQAVVAVDYECEVVYDAGWGKFLNIEVVNTLTAL
jgi:hypothetical protein